MKRHGLLSSPLGSKLQVIPINDRGELLIDEFAKLLSPRTKIISIVHLSNALGTINPVEQIIQMAHRHNVPVLLDGAQWVAHKKTDATSVC